YLMDEPLSNLDAKLRVQTRTELAELQRRLAVTTIYVTHDQVEAMTMGHRVAVLRDGLLQQCDTPHALYHQPVNLFVAGFIGSPAMNFVTCDAAWPLEVGGVPLDTPAQPPDDLGESPDGTVVAGVRPEAVLLGAPGASKLAGEIRVVEDLGAEAFVHVAVAHRGDTASLVAKVPAPFAGVPGDAVSLRIIGPVHVFDDDGGRRLTTPRAELAVGA